MGDNNEFDKSETNEEAIIDDLTVAENNIETNGDEKPYEEPMPHKVPHDSPYSPLYNPRGDKISKNTLTAVLMFTLVFFLIIALIMAVSHIVKKAMFEVNTSQVMNGNLSKDIKDFFGKGDIQDNEIPEENESIQDGDYIPSSNDKYYDHIVDSIDKTLSYSIKKETYNYTDADKNVDIYIDYPQITNSTIERQDSINEYIEETAQFYLKNYAAHPEKGNVSDCTIIIQSYVTFTSEDMMSIVLDEQIDMQGISYLDLFCINVDIPSGQILDNKNMVTFSEELGKEFRSVSNRQNGKIDFIDMISDKEIANYMEDNKSGIVFYTPVGLELGFNYAIENQSGWITATFKDYQKLIKKI